MHIGGRPDRTGGGRGKHHGPLGSGANNPLLYAVAWKQTAAEYRALYYQGFNVARMHVELALAKRKPGDKPLAVVTDMDNTILHPINYWGHLINKNKDYFDDPVWDGGFQPTR